MTAPVRLSLDAVHPNPLQPTLSNEVALASLSEMCSAAAWVQRVGRRHNAATKDMDIITQIIELGAAAWQFDVPLEVFKVKAPDNTLKDLTPGKYWLWIHLDLGDDNLWRHFGAVVSEFGSGSLEESVRDHALQLLRTVEARQEREMLQELAAGLPVEPAGDAQPP